MADFETVQDQLYQLLRDLGDTYKFKVFEVAVPTGYKLPMEHNVHMPYVLISFGGKSPVAGPQQGITGTRQDLKNTSVALECVANSPASVRKVVRIVRNAFEGYQPDPSWGELVERLSGDYTVNVPDYDLWPVRYATGIVFNTHANAVT